MYKINKYNISGVRNYVDNPDWRVVMTNYVCVYVVFRFHGNFCPIWSKEVSISSQDNALTLEVKTKKTIFVK